MVVCDDKLLTWAWVKSTLGDYYNLFPSGQNSPLTKRQESRLVMCILLRAYREYHGTSFYSKKESLMWLRWYYRECREKWEWPFFALRMSVLNEEKVLNGCAIVHNA